MDLDYEEIGLNLTLCRKLRHLKQAELAEKVSVTAQHISHIECAISKPSLSLIVRIAEVLDVSLYKLLGTNTPKRYEAEVDLDLSRELANATVGQKNMILALSRTYLELDRQENP